MSYDCLMLFWVKKYFLYKASKWEKCETKENIGKINFVHSFAKFQAMLRMPYT
jgi:hypothetical protein